MLLDVEDKRKENSRVIKSSAQSYYVGRSEEDWVWGGGLKHQILNIIV